MIHHSKPRREGGGDSKGKGLCGGGTTVGRNTCNRNPEMGETGEKSIQDGTAEAEAAVAAAAAGTGCGGVVRPAVESPFAFASVLRASWARLCAAIIMGLGGALFFFGFAASATILLTCDHLSRQRQNRPQKGVYTYRSSSRRSWSDSSGTVLLKIAPRSRRPRARLYSSWSVAPWSFSTLSTTCMKWD
jgi:hypothetical protein